MQELDNTAGAPRQLGRRTILKGAAWSAPVIAAAVATPLAAASDNQARIAIDAGCVQIAGVGLLPGFTVTNSGTDAYSGTVTITETIDLSSIDGLGSSAVRSLLWTTLVLQTAGGLLEGSTAGVTVGGWTGSDGDGWIASGIFASSYKKATRTVTIAAPLTVGAPQSWGQLLSINLSQLLGGTWSAAIVDPTGNPPVTKSADDLPFSLLGGC